MIVIIWRTEEPDWEVVGVFTPQNLLSLLLGRKQSERR